MEQMKIAMPKGQYPSINEDDIKNFSIPVPPIEEQQEIVEKIEKLEQEIKENSSNIELVENALKAIKESGYQLSYRYSLYVQLSSGLA